MKTITFYTILFCVIACTNKSQVMKGSVSNSEMQALISTDFHINGMTCTGCEKTIVMTVKGIDGVKDVTASYIDSLATVTFDSTMTTTAMISQKINELG
jgi:mercuric ion transport protein